MIAGARLQALGTGISVSVTDEAALALAVAVVEHELACVDFACSRFRPDSELSRWNRLAGEWVAVSPLLMAALEVACRAAELTQGLVDPTIGNALLAAGYDDDFDRIAKGGPAVAVDARPAIGYKQVRLDPENGRAWIPAGLSLDLGATAKALAADRAASAVHALTGDGVLVNCGGDLATAGAPPAGGWSIRVSAHHADPPNAPGETVSLTQGGLATSGTGWRRWRRGDQDLHHIIDPRTGRPAVTPWTLATVAAATCVDANIASTAVIVMGEAAPAWLERQGLAARLVGDDGTVLRVGGWPT